MTGKDSEFFCCDRYEMFTKQLLSHQVCPNFLYTQSAPNFKKFRIMKEPQTKSLRPKTRLVRINQLKKASGFKMGKSTQFLVPFKKKSLKLIKVIFWGNYISNKTHCFRLCWEVHIQKWYAASARRVSILLLCLFLSVKELAHFQKRVVLRMPSTRAPFWAGSMKSVTWLEHIQKITKYSLMEPLLLQY